MRPAPRLVAEPVQPALGDEREVAGLRVKPFLAVVQLDLAVEHEERLVMVRWKWTSAPPGSGPMSHR